MEKTKKRRLQLLAASVFWLGVWQAAAMAIGQEVFLVSPVQALGTLVQLLPQAEFWQRVAFSAGRILLGFGLGALSSTVLAVAAEKWEWVDALLAPVMQLVKATPVASFIILALVWVSGSSLSVLISFLMVLPVLYGGEPESATPGVQLEFAADTSAASDSAASSEAAAPADKRLDSLNTLLTALDSSGLGADVTRIEFEDPEQMAFLYQGRISVLLGTLNELDYKLRLAKYVLLDEDGKGCSPTDTGMLDLSHLSASSTRKFRFAQGEPTLPSGYIAPVQAEAPAQTEPQPEEASDPEPDTEGADAAPADEPTAAAAEQQ